VTRIRPCGPLDEPQICSIINDAAEAYRGIIPADRWHEPYMPLEELKRQVAQGIAFSGYEADGELLGVIRFYEKNGYRVLSRPETERLLRTHWSIPERQIETSVVLAK
jgi:hypothetical protein